MKTILYASFMTLFLAGCVGAGPVVTKTAITKVKAKPYDYENICPSKEIGLLSGCKDQHVTPPPTTADFTKAWGAPKVRELKDGQEHLTYNANIAWRGLVVFAIIPIPLMLPVGHNELTLSFENDKLIKTSIEYGQGNYAICGLHSEGPDPIGCVIMH